MRLWHLLFLVLLCAVVFTVAREPAGRVALVVFVTLVGEMVSGTTAVMMLFQTVGAFGQARGLVAHLEAVAATTVVLGVATAVMSGLFFVGAWLVQASVS